ncbi:hypothetical protein Bcep1808_6258 [Burkholderia vietnamiensis G4]|uniref:Uncharacterized protein n=1 Tax=Burkholderia vietnamiensis (strain G4 / LMG 22486) TaxID=269482 RepID=A4JSA6_BURVG|nr:hypothetical protein Bcep1808_6258 [Burkholderia vietnamiensis G4]
MHRRLMQMVRQVGRPDLADVRRIPTMSILGRRKRSKRCATPANDPADQRRLTNW